MFFTYILKSKKNGKYYIGSTSNLQERLNAHNSGKNTSTRYGRPWSIIYCESYQTKSEAWLRERQIKKYKHGEAFKKLISYSRVV